MRKFVRTVWTLAAVLGAGLLVASCGDGNGGGGNGTEPDPTQIRATVRADGSARSGVTVSLFTSGGTTATEEGTTNASGQVTFEVDPGTYEVEIEIPEGLEMDGSQTSRREVMATEGSTASVTFDMVTPADPNVTEVTLNASSFSPADVTIDVGQTVRWVNGQSITHTITPDGHSEWAGVTVNDEGETFEHTFQNTGAFDYLCQFHAGMVGTVTVN